MSKFPFLGYDGYSKNASLNSNQLDKTLSDFLENFTKNFPEEKYDYLKPEQSNAPSLHQQSTAPSFISKENKDYYVNLLNTFSKKIKNNSLYDENTQNIDFNPFYKNPVPEETSTLDKTNVLRSKLLDFVLKTLEKRLRAQDINLSSEELNLLKTATKPNFEEEILKIITNKLSK